MNKEVAKSLLEKMLKCAAILDEAYAVACEIEDVNEQLTLKQALAELMGDSYVNVVMKIVFQYPDLDPLVPNQSSGQSEPPPS